ncbi:MAG: hypothetical protein ACI8QT_001838 [Halioglobus sp.]|jgi:hypothetical protein
MDTTQAGFVHGGVYLSLLDTLMSRAIGTLLADGHYSSTMALNDNSVEKNNTNKMRVHYKLELRLYCLCLSIWADSVAIFGTVAIRRHRNSQFH